MDKLGVAVSGLSHSDARDQRNRLLVDSSGTPSASRSHLGLKRRLDDALEQVRPLGRMTKSKSLEGLRVFHLKPSKRQTRNALPFDLEPSPRPGKSRQDCRRTQDPHDKPAKPKLKLHYGRKTAIGFFERSMFHHRLHCICSTACPKTTVIGTAIEQAILSSLKSPQCI